jgi:hypothetical protein
LVETDVYLTMSVQRNLNRKRILYTFFKEKDTLMNKNLPTTPRLVMEMRQDADNLFRWYEMGTDTAADVCPAADTPTQSWENAAAVWSGTAWNLKRLSPTVAEIDGDFPPPPATYTLTPEQHEKWYSDDQRIHDAIHNEVRGMAHEIYDLDGNVIDVEGD